MQITEVTSKEIQKLFHQVPPIIYKNDPHWACPLQGMVEDIFTPSKNPSFKTGEAARWILKDDKGQLLGRIGAFYNLY